MDTRRALDGQAVGLMLLLCMIWSLQQISLKAVAPDMAPMLMIALRSGIAALLVGLLMGARGERVSPGTGRWRPGMLVGGLFALEYLLLGEGLRHTQASHIAVFVYTAPIFAALGLHWRVPAERLQPLQWGGIVLAFAGIALAFLVRAPQSAASASASAAGMLWGDLLGLLAGAAWGATTVVLRCSRLAAAPATETLLYQLAGAFVVLLLAALALGQTEFTPTPRLWAHLAFQALVVSFASFLAWFWLLRHYLASRLGVLSFMTPLFGLGFGVLLLGEPLETGFVAGSVLVLLGVALISGHGWLSQAFKPAAKPEAAPPSRTPRRELPPAAPGLRR